MNTTVIIAEVANLVLAIQQFWSHVWYDSSQFVQCL